MPPQIVLILVALVAAFLLFGGFVRSKSSHAIACTDASANIPKGHKTAPLLSQLPGRLVGGETVVFEEIDLFQPPEVSTYGGINAFAFVERIVKAGNPLGLRFYADQVAGYGASYPEVLPESWHRKKVWFLGRIYLDAAENFAACRLTRDGEIGSWRMEYVPLAQVRFGSDDCIAVAPRDVPAFGARPLQATAAA